MDNQKLDPKENEGNRDKAYQDELAGKGSTFLDTPAESEGRDQAKMEKALSGETQKMDSAHPDDLQDDGIEEEVRRETLENK